jgi:SAM-dependent methyltransferase
MKQSSIWDFLYLKKLNKEGLLEQSDWLKKYEKYLTSVKKELVIDLGCGEGGNTLFLHNQGYRVIACDFSQVVLDRIKEENSNISINNFDMNEGIPYGNGSVGIVITSLSTHYFTFEQTKKLYDNIYKCLKPGGYYIYRTNSYKEFERNQDNMLKSIEKDYYLTKNGKKKRYFTVESMAQFLNNFDIIENFDTELEFNGVRKYAVEGVARKPIK